MRRRRAEALLKTLAAAEDAGDFPDARLRASRLELGRRLDIRCSSASPVPIRRRCGALPVRCGQVMRDNPHIRNVSDDWGNLGKSVRIDVDQDKARLLGLSSQDVAQTLQTLLQGVTVSQYRENLDLIPIVLRAEAAERHDLGDLGNVTVRGATGRMVPLSQVATVRPVLEEAYFNAAAGCRP